MTWRKQTIAAGLALLCFLVLTVLAQAWGEPTLIAIGVLLSVITALYFRYRRRMGRDVPPPTAEFVPLRDDRIIPQDVKIQVAIRDGGVCQLRYMGCTVDRDIQYDHRVAWSRGGSSKDADNIQLACGHCNRMKSDKILA